MKPLSPALTTLAHIVWGGIFGLLISGGAAISQYNATNGINIPQDAAVFALAVLTGIGSASIATWNNIKKSPALPVAEAEVESVAKDQFNQFAQSVHGRLSTIEAWLQSHIQTHAASVPSTPVQAPQSAPVPSSLSKITLQPLPAQSTPNIAPAGSVPLTTVPAMPVVQVHQ